MTADAVCRILDWDSAFFKKRIARIESRQLDAKTVREILAFARAEEVDCFYFLANEGDEDSHALARANGFEWVDTRVTHERRLTSEDAEGLKVVAPARDSDLARLASIARSSHTTTRFYHDARFPRERCDSLYAEWITGTYARSPESVLVVREEALARGYVVCSQSDPGVGEIGLIAVDEGSRGRALGSKLMRGALAHFAANGCERVRVVSQERNQGAGRLYARFGMKLRSSERWYHFWPTPEQRA